MRRNASYLLVCTLIVVLAGCKNKNKGSDAAFGNYDPYAMPASETSYEPIPAMPSYSTPATTTTVADSWETSASSTGMGGGRQHTVVQKDTLYSLARQYYGDHTKWRQIYEANRTQISDPNKIRVGQRLLIP
jgi:nucleoid-associated protein YgaU